MSIIHVEKYTDFYKSQWDNFIRESKNGHFMFYRDYMEYHKDRFIDNSIIVSENNKIIALLPANIIKNNNNGFEIISHNGLTFGGLILNKKATVSKVIDIFEHIINFCRLNNIQKFIYKPIPYIYHVIPSQEDIYCLYRFGFKIIRRDVSSTIFLKDKIKFSKGRKYCLNKAIKNNLKVDRSFDFKKFMDLECEILNKKYGKNPVHTWSEMDFLSKKFPNNIKLFTCYKDNELLSGIIIYENNKIAHTQYMAVSDKGKELGALDIVIDNLINNYYKDKLYFDFGISTEDNGIYLNKGLIMQKEMFGARAVTYDFYELNL